MKLSLFTERTLILIYHDSIFHFEWRYHFSLSQIISLSPTWFKKKFNNLILNYLCFYFCTGNSRLSSSKFTIVSKEINFNFNINFEFNFKWRWFIKCRVVWVIDGLIISKVKMIEWEISRSTYVPATLRIELWTILNPYSCWYHTALYCTLLCRTVLPCTLHCTIM